MEHPSGRGLYLPFVKSSVLGIGVGIISTTCLLDMSIGHAFGEPQGSPIDVEEFLAQDRTDIARNRIITHHAVQPSEITQAFSRLVRTIPRDMMSDDMRGWIGFDEGTFVPVVGNASLIADERAFASLFRNYPLHRIDEDNDLRNNLLACYMRAIQSPRKDEILRAIEILVPVFGYPYPGTGNRWTFRLPDDDSKGHMFGVTWIPPPGYDPCDIEATFDPEIAREYCPDAHVQIPTVTASVIDKLIFIAPLSVSGAHAAPAHMSRGSVIHSLDTVGIEARRIDYMFPIAISHIGLDGAITMI